MWVMCKVMMLVILVVVLGCARMATFREPNAPHSKIVFHMLMVAVEVTLGSFMNEGIGAVSKGVVRKAVKPVLGTGLLANYITHMIVFGLILYVSFRGLKDTLVTRLTDSTVGVLMSPLTTFFAADKFGFVFQAMQPLYHVRLSWVVGSSSRTMLSWLIRGKVEERFNFVDRFFRRPRSIADVGYGGAYRGHPRHRRHSREDRKEGRHSRDGRHRGKARPWSAAAAHVFPA
jgi:hypothetical protein